MVKRVLLPYIIGEGSRAIPYQYENICRNIDVSEFRPTIYSEQPSGTIRREGVRELHIQSNWKYRKHVKMVLSSLSKHDILHTGGGPKLRYLMSNFSYLRNPGLSHVHTLHIDVDPEADYDTEYKRKLVSRADVVTAVSEHTAKTAKEAFGVEPTVIYNAVDTSFFHPNRDPPELLDSMPTDRPVFLFVGKFEPRKNPLDVIKLAEMYDDGLFLLRGSGSLEEEVKSSAEGVENVVLLERLTKSTLADLYSNVDAFVFPSTREGCPTVVLEAMASGTPVVGYRATSMPELVTDGETGVLAKPGSITGLEQGISKISKQNLQDSLGDNARTYINSNHTFDITTTQYEKSYAKVLNIG